MLLGALFYAYMMILCIVFMPGANRGQRHQILKSRGYRCCETPAVDSRTFQALSKSSRCPDC